jgi:multiple sugar transport system permease protein
VTIVWTILVVSFSGLLGLGTALLLNEEYRFRGIVRSIIIIPWVAPPVVIAYIWVWIYSAGFSPISDFLERVHLISGPIYWLSDLSIKVGPLSFPLLSLVLVGVWAGFPFVAVVFLAALQSIPREVLDAADIDSASSWQKFRHITLPLIAKVGQISILLSTIWTFNQFVYPYLMTKGGPLNFTDVLSVFIYQKAFTDFNFGYATAAAVVMTTFSGIFVALYIISSYRSLFE